MWLFFQLHRQQCTSFLTIKDKYGGREAFSLLPICKHLVVHCLYNLSQGPAHIRQPINGHRELWLLLNTMIRVMMIMMMTIMMMMDWCSEARKPTENVSFMSHFSLFPLSTFSLANKDPKQWKSRDSVQTPERQAINLEVFIFLLVALKFGFLGWRR